VVGAGRGLHDAEPPGEARARDLVHVARQRGRLRGADGRRVARHRLGVGRDHALPRVLDDLRGDAPAVEAAGRREQARVGVAVNDDEAAAFAHPAQQLRRLVLLELLAHAADDDEGGRALAARFEQLRGRAIPARDLVARLLQVFVEGARARRPGVEGRTVGIELPVAGPLDLHVGGGVERHEQDEHHGDGQEDGQAALHPKLTAPALRGRPNPATPGRRP
jgi:hypothetical protein